MVVIGHQTEQLRAHLAGRPDVQVALQEPQLGTGHALLQAEPFLAGRTGTVLLLSGDVPLLRAATVQALVSHHASRRAAATVLTATVERPAGYGRIVREDGAISAIVEHKDATAERAGHRGNQQRRLRVRPGAAFRGPAASRVGERSGRVLSS